LPEPPRLFLSYARADDEPFVKQLYHDLTARGFTVWWDRVSMPSRALTFLQEIRDAVDASDRLLAVIGPQAVKSDYVTSEWQHALLFAKGVVPQVEMANPYEIAVEVVNLYKDAAWQSGITLESDLQEDIAEAPLDPRGIHTCLANLVSNAMDACLMSNGKKPAIQVYLYERKGAISFEVRDNGCGMDCEVKKKIFTNFFTTKGSGQGTGLGLLTTRKIVQEHGGKISFDSTLGKGSVFRMEFDRSRLPLPKEQKHLS